MTNDTSNAERKLTLTRTLDAPLKKVWRAWTDPIEVAKWWGPRGVTNPTCEIDVRVGGKLNIVMLAGQELGKFAGQKWPMRGEFQEVKEHEKLVFTNQAIDESGNVLIDGLTTVTFAADGDKTTITMTTVAQPMTPEVHQMVDGMEAGWSQSLDKLGELFQVNA